MTHRADLITAAATATRRSMFELLKEDALGFRAAGATPAEVASYAVTVGAEMAFCAMGLSTILANDESRAALVDEALELITETLRSRRDELVLRARAAAGDDV